MAVLGGNGLMDCRVWCRRTSSPTSGTQKALAGQLGTWDPQRLARLTQACPLCQNLSGASSQVAASPLRLAALSHPGDCRPQEQLPRVATTLRSPALPSMLNLLE